MIQFEDNKYYYEIKNELNEGYKCVHNLDQKIVDEEICYTIEATYDAGIANNSPNPETPPSGEGEENDPEEIFFYKPNLYFIKDRNNYLLSKIDSMSLDTQYYLLTDKNNKLYIQTLLSLCISFFALIDIPIKSFKKVCPSQLRDHRPRNTITKALSIASRQKLM